MRRQGKYWAIAVLFLILIVITGFISANNKKNKNAISGTDDAEGHAALRESLASYQKEEDVIMADMMKDMEDIPKTGSAGIDFLLGMIPHHEAAVSMSESYLKYGPGNETLKKMAENIIDVQNSEITQMKSIIERLEDAGTRDEEKEAAYLIEYQKLFDAHHMEHQTSDNIDEAFVQGMAMHHQMAIDMSKSILDYTEDEEIIKLAKNIIELQEKELAEMEGIFHNHNH